MERLIVSHFMWLCSCRTAPTKTVTATSRYYVW
jgi:hypothetical protein